MVFSLFITANAWKIGDVVNSTLYTDIVASINNYNIESYNIDGYTAIVAEDLAKYGFDVTYNNSKRALYVSRGSTNTITSTYNAPAKDKNKVGNKVHDVLYTDIKTYVDGKVVKSYNIGGRTIIYINALDVYGSINYNNDTRKIDLTINDGLSFKSVRLLEENPPYELRSFRSYSSAEGKSFKMGGAQYSDGIVSPDSWAIDRVALFNIDSKYSSLECVIGHVTFEEYAKSVSFIVDGKIVDTIRIEPDSLPKKVRIPLKYGLQLKIRVNDIDDGKMSGVGIGNITVK